MSAISEISTYIDDLPNILETYFEPTEVWWHREEFIHAYYSALGCGGGPDESGIHSNDGKNKLRFSPDGCVYIYMSVCVSCVSCVFPLTH